MRYWPNHDAPAMNHSNSIKLFATQEHPCSYAPKRVARVIFVDPEHDVDEQNYFELNRLGFRRSGTHFYRPQCPNCNACISTRVDVKNFKLSRSQKRVIKNNADLTVLECTGIENLDDHFELFEKYIRLRHADGDMFPASKAQFQDFINSSSGNTWFTEFRRHDKLIAVSVKDRLLDGWSAIYTYFDPDESQRSPGAFAILTMIDSAKHLGLPYVYLGYWIEDVEKMNYKTQYRPIELYLDQRWQQLR